MGRSKSTRPKGFPALIEGGTQRACSILDKVKHAGPCRPDLVTWWYVGYVFLEWLFRAASAEIRVRWLEGFREQIQA